MFDFYNFNFLSVLFFVARGGWPWLCLFKYSFWCWLTCNAAHWLPVGFVSLAFYSLWGYLENPFYKFLLLAKLLACLVSLWWGWKWASNQGICSSSSGSGPSQRWRQPECAGLDRHQVISSLELMRPHKRTRRCSSANQCDGVVQYHKPLFGGAAGRERPDFGAFISRGCY